MTLNSQQDGIRKYFVALKCSELNTRVFGRPIVSLLDFNPEKRKRTITELEVSPTPQNVRPPDLDEGKYSCYKILTKIQFILSKNAGSIKSTHLNLRKKLENILETMK